MNALLWCLVIVTFLPFPLALVGFNLRKKQFGFIDNKQPRLQQQQLTGMAARALGAQQNAWEALMMFAPIALIAQYVGADPVKAGLAAIAFVVLRFLHAIFYLADLDMLRSSTFMLGIVSLIYLVVLSA